MTDFMATQHADDLKSMDGMLRLVGEMIRLAILDAHPKSPRVSEATREEARTFVLDVFNGKTSMQLVEAVWRLPYKEATKRTTDVIGKSA